MPKTSASRDLTEKARELLKGTDWSLARCIGITTEIFFPESYEERNFQMIRKICSQCEIQSECLEMGIATNSIGFWGGVLLTDKNRRERARDRR